MITVTAISQTPTSAPNAFDDEGRKTGLWAVYAREKNLEGYPPDAVYEIGPYEKDRKQGIWTRFFASGRKWSEINYERGRKRGAFKIYRDSDKNPLYEEGAMTPNGQTMVGQHTMISEDGVKLIEKNYDENGRMEGKQIMRYPNGQVQVEFEKKDGKNVGTTTYYYENGDVKKTIEYNDDGTVKETKELDRVNPPFKPEKPVEKTKKAPPIPKGLHYQEGGKKIDVVKINDCRKLFNDAGDIVYDGCFEKGEFKEGKLYIYDEDGLLHHIEVYKDFRYAGNGVIGKD